MPNLRAVSTKPKQSAVATRPKKLTKAEQLKILHALPAENKKMIKKHFKHHLQAGSGVMDTIKSFLSKAASVIGPIAKEIGPIALKEFIVPMIKDKLKGGAIMTAGRGGALRLAGQHESSAIRGAESAKPMKPVKKRLTRLPKQKSIHVVESARLM